MGRNGKKRSYDTDEGRKKKLDFMKTNKKLQYKL